jgi:hypothetical protein
MTDFDWSQVPVERRPEVRRRIAVLDRFLAIANPSAQDRRLAAEDIGVSSSMFSALTRAWARDKNPAHLPGAHTRSRDRPAGRSVPPGTEPIIAAVLQELGPVDPSRGIREVEARCQAAGLKSPTRPTLRRRFRMAADPDAPCPSQLMIQGLTIDSCALDLPTTFRESLRAPVVTAAFAEPGGRIVGYRCAFERHSGKGAATLVRNLIRTEPLLLDLNIAITAAHALEWRLLIELLNDGGVAAETRIQSPSREFRRLVGESLGGVRLAQRRTTNPAADLRARAKPLAEATARDIVAEAIGIHNSKRAVPLRPHKANTPSAFPARLDALLEWYLALPEQAD